MTFIIGAAPGMKKYTADEAMPKVGNSCISMPS
ncbi:hypothetical protein FHS38_006792 [Streptomyces netropsis]|uniref:Uncharacterized protein n=1 Tax=Streptomyces netropsis TaxID=55404 RepID=A0A7W7PI60_STRNE|nr:hypothetical protein [Streptomyces netropsis]